MVNDSISPREFSDRLASIDRRLETQSLMLTNIEIHLTKLNGTVAVNTEKIKVIEAEDKRIEATVNTILNEGCDQKHEHERVVEALTSAGAISSEPCGAYKFPNLSTKQKAGVGVGIAALLIPAAADLFAFMHKVADWLTP